MSYNYNGDAYGRSQFDDNYSHGGPLGGSVNVDGSFYSSGEQIYDAHQIYEGKLAALRNKAKNESGLGDLAPQIASFPKIGDQKNGNNYTVAVEVAVGGASSDRINTENMYNYMKWKDQYNAKHYGTKLFDGVPTQDTYISGELGRAAVWRQYGKNFNDLADFSEKAVIGIGVGAGTAMGGFIVAPYVISVGETVISGYAEIELQTYIYANSAYNSIIQGTVQRVGLALIKYLPRTALGTKAFQKTLEFLITHEIKNRNIAKDGKKILELYRNINKAEKLH
jgi:hypothetical protein